MYTIQNLTRPLIQNISFSENNIFITGLKKHAKVAAIAIVIFSTLTALYFIFRSYQSRKVKSSERDIPIHISPVKKPFVPNQKPLSPAPSLIHSPSPSPAHSPIPPLNKPTPTPIYTPLPVKPFVPYTSSSLPTNAFKIKPPHFSVSTEPSNLSQGSGSDIAKPLSNQSKFETEPKIHHKPASKPHTVVEPLPQVITPVKPEPAKKYVKPLPFVQVDEICEQIMQNLFNNSSFSTQEAFNQLDRKAYNDIVNTFNELVLEAERRFEPDEKIQIGTRVPEYFANVTSDHSEQVKKYLSLVGIRNLLVHGPRIIDDLRRKKFLGGEHNYQHDEGLKAFKLYTGNTVDLDTELNHEIFKDDSAAIQKAKELIVNFGEACGLEGKQGKLTAEDVSSQMPQRLLHLPNLGKHVYISNSNTERSMHGIWKRIPPQKMDYRYYVNVPNTEIVLAACLKFPYMIVEVIQRVKGENGGNLPREFLEDFFTKGLSTMCFNDKIITYLNFYIKYINEESPSPEEEVRQKIEKLEFGEDLLEIGTDKAIKGKYDKFNHSLSDVLLKYYVDDDNNLINPLDTTITKEEWVKGQMEACIAILAANDIWKSALYQSEAGNEYFLVDESTLKLVLRDFYEILTGFM